MSATRLILRGGRLLDFDHPALVTDPSDIRIVGNTIETIAPADSLTAPGNIIIDCRDTLITPGLINTHTHAATWIFRGLVEDKPADYWGATYTLPGQDRMTEADYAASIRAACGELLLNGVTCIADRLGNIDVMSPHIDASGIRAVVGQTVADDNGAPDWRKAEAVLERWGTDPRRRIFAGIAPRSLDGSSDALLAECARRAERLGARVFVHVAQSRPEIAALRARGYRGALDCLHQTGLVGPHIVAAHGIYLDDDEIDAWPTHRISLAHCPASNLKIEARTAKLHRFIGKIAVGLGTDWTASNNSNDLLAEARLASLVGKLIADDPTALDLKTMLRLLTVEGARVLGLDGIVGEMKTGQRADLVVWDAQRLAFAPDHNLAANLLHAANVRSVRDVLVDGDILVRDGRLTRTDEQALIDAQRGSATKLRR